LYYKENRNYFKTFFILDVMHILKIYSYSNLAELH